MKLDSVRFVKDQALQREESGEIELSSANLETVYGGGNCPGSNGIPFGGNLSQGPGYNYGGNFSQGPGYNYGSFSGNGYGNSFNEQPPPCPYSY